MAEDSTAPTEGTQDPAADTQAAPTGDTAENTPQAQPVDWQERYRNLQADHTRKGQELAEARRQLAEAQALIPSDDGEEDEPEPQAAPVQRQRKVDLTAELAKERAAREQLEWQLAEGVYGQEVLAAYDSAAQMIQTGTTVSDSIAAFEAYHQARMKAPAAPPTDPSAPQAPSQAEATAPRVLAPRPDDAQAQRLYEQEVEAARQAGGDAGLRAIMAAAIKKAGIAG